MFDPRSPLGRGRFRGDASAPGASELQAELARALRDEDARQPLDATARVVEYRRAQCLARLTSKQDHHRRIALKTKPRRRLRLPGLQFNVGASISS
jgi:hypothetical protein